MDETFLFDFGRKHDPSAIDMIQMEGLDAHARQLLRLYQKEKNVRYVDNLSKIAMRSHNCALCFLEALIGSEDLYAFFLRSHVALTTYLTASENWASIVKKSGISKFGVFDLCSALPNSITAILVILRHGLYKMNPRNEDRTSWANIFTGVDKFVREESGSFEEKIQLKLKTSFPKLQQRLAQLYIGKSHLDKNELPIFAFVEKVVKDMHVRETLEIWDHLMEIRREVRRTHKEIQVLNNLVSTLTSPLEQFDYNNTTEYVDFFTYLKNQNFTDTTERPADFKKMWTLEALFVELKLREEYRNNQ